MDTRIKLIALDLDGTLLHSDKSISEANRRAVRRALDSGIHVVLASGRMHSATARYARGMDFASDSYIISYNGGMGRRLSDQAPLFEHPVSPDKAQWVVRFAAERGLHLNYYLRDRLYTARRDRWSELYRERTGCVSQFADDLALFDGERPTKLVIIDSKEVVAQLTTVLKDHFQDNAQVLVTDDEYLEIMENDATKGLALQTIAAKLNVAREECMAMGDGYNDLTMLKWAGRGIAMSNGRKSLLEQVSEHAPPADEDGAAVKINELLDNLQ